MSDAYVCRPLPLTCLAPDIVEALLDGRQPKGLRLAEMLGNGPLGWERCATAVIQCRRFDSAGFQQPNHRMLGLGAAEVRAKAGADGREAKV